MRKKNLFILLGLTSLSWACGVDSSNRRKPPARANLGDFKFCTESVQSYQNLIKPIVETRCINCHAQGKTAGFVVSFAAGEDQVNAEKFSRLLGGDASAIYNKVSNPESHGGGRQLQPEDEAKLKEFFSISSKCVSSIGPTTPTAASLCKAEPIPRRINLLSSAEYSNAVLDLTGYSISVSIPAATTVLDSNNSPRLAFANDQKSRTVDTNLRFAFERAAISIASNISTEKLASYGCTTERLNDECIRKMGARAFRRPLTTEEVTAFREFSTVREYVGFLVQSPDFLYLSQVGDTNSATRMTHFEIASLMSFTLTGFPPDSELMALAEQSKLYDGKVREQQARRLINASLAQNGPLVEFFADWLELGKSKKAAKQGSYDGNSVYRDSMTFIRSQLDDEGSLMSLFTSEYQSRKGLLEQRAFIAAHSNDQSTSPVKVGKTISSNLLCVSMPPPPPNVSTELRGSAEAKTTRQKLEAHTKNPSCSGCHTRIDPFGLAFEGFDQAGFPRAMENGVQVDTSVSLSIGLTFDSNFGGSSDLIEKIAQSPELSNCFESFFQQRLYGIQSCENQNIKNDESIRDYVARLMGTERFIVRK